MKNGKLLSCNDFRLFIWFRLTRFFFNAALHTPNNLSLAPYDRAMVRIEKINARDDKLILSLVKLL